MTFEQEFRLPAKYNNSLIKKLPNHLTDKDIYKAFSNDPEYEESLRELPAHNRKIYAETIKSSFLKPLPFNFEIFNELMRTMRAGYIGRDLFDPEYRQKLNNMNTRVANITGFSILGESGMGKSTTIKSILNLIPQVIFHNEHEGRKLSQPQITWIYLECPSNKSIATLCYRFLSAIDAKMGTTYKKKYATANEKDLIAVMPQIAAEFSLGGLIIEEIQRLNRTTKQGKDEMIDFFVELSNSIGVPVIVAGTPDAKEIIARIKAVARRFEAIYLSNLDKEGDFKVMLEQLWKFQYTNVKTPLTPAIFDAIWDETQGVPDTMIKLYEDVQLYLIGGGNETITPEIIHMVSKEKEPLVNEINKHGAIDAPRKKVEASPVNSPVTIKGENRLYSERDMIAHTFITLLKYPLPKAYDFTDSLLQRFPGLDISSLVQKGIELHSQPSGDINNEKQSSTIQPSKAVNRKKKELDIDSLPPDDLRRIYLEGKRDGISTYDALKKAKMIKSPEDLI